MRRVPLHVVAGSLGVGKTTALRHLLAGRADREQSAVIVNDFGEAGIDAATLDGRVRVTNIAGGCVCCTAPEGLVEAVNVVLDTLAPDRIFIEPSGLARPADVLDMLGRGPIAGRLARRPVILLVDPVTFGDADAGEASLESADFVVINRVEIAPRDAVAVLRGRLLDRWPPPLAVLETSFGALPESVLDWPGTPPEVVARGEMGHHDHDHLHVGATVGPAHGMHAASWSFPAETVLAFDALLAIVNDTDIARFKGMFRTDLGWFRFDRAGGRPHVEATAWRRDSRADAIAADPETLRRVGERLSAAVGGPSSGTGRPQVRLEALSGESLALDAAALATLPGQVPDVGSVVPGRRGSGVWLREVLHLVPAPAGTRFVVTAEDGLTTPPVPVAGAGDAVLVTSLDGAAYPVDQGGPFRILGPSGDGRTACANVKGVARIRLLSAD